MVVATRLDDVLGQTQIGSVRLDGYVVNVMAVWLIHVLHQGAAGCHVNNLGASANR